MDDVFLEDLKDHAFDMILRFINKGEAHESEFKKIDLNRVATVVDKYGYKVSVDETGRINLLKKTDDDNKCDRQT